MPSGGCGSRHEIFSSSTGRLLGACRHLKRQLETGSGLKQLIDEAGPYAQYPALSPHGEEVLYTQEINGDFQIFKLNLNSGVRTQLTHISWNTGGDWFDPVYALPVSPQPELLTTTWGELKRE